jgi:glucose-1-phosphate adenylyltransferase
MRARPRILAIVLAGGEGKRLMPLTMDRAKPAVPFGGTYRLIDFVLSNLANAGMRQIAVLTQYKSHSLDKHISLSWRMSTMLGNYVTPVPAQQRLGPRWYQGSADAIYQSMNLIRDEEPDYVVVFGADNIYRMDVSQMLDSHIDGGLGCTVAGIRVPRSQASAFGVIDAGADSKIKDFLEKPAEPPGLPDDPEASFASMGNYIFSTVALIDALNADAENEDSRHDMGADIIPSFVGRGDSQVYDFTANEVPGSTERDRAYWRDVGTLDAYHEAHMDLISVDPMFNLYNLEWPIWTYPVQMPGAKFTMDGVSRDSIASPGCVVSGGSIESSVLSPNVRVHENARVDHSVILSHASIGRDAVVHRAILDKNVILHDGAQVGVDPEADQARGFAVSEGGITVVGKGVTVSAT